MYDKLCFKWHFCRDLQDDNVIRKANARKNNEDPKIKYKIFKIYIKIYILTTFNRWSSSAFSWPFLNLDVVMEALDGLLSQTTFKSGVVPWISWPEEVYSNFQRKRFWEFSGLWNAWSFLDHDATSTLGKMATLWTARGSVSTRTTELGTGTSFFRIFIFARTARASSVNWIAEKKLIS